MNKAMHEEKQITIVYMEQGNEMEEDLSISPMKTVGYLKGEIERIFRLNLGTLKKLKLRMTKRGERTGTTLDDDNKKLFDYRIQTGAKITFTILENVGGKRALY
jgi:hypothetical protein